MGAWEGLRERCGSWMLPAAPRACTVGTALLRGNMGQGGYFSGRRWQLYLYVRWLPTPRPDRHIAVLAAARGAGSPPAARVPLAQAHVRHGAGGAG
jgi:hypothetical protein